MPETQVVLERPHLLQVATDMIIFQPGQLFIKSEALDECKNYVGKKQLDVHKAFTWTHRHSEKNCDFKKLTWLKVEFELPNLNEISYCLAGWARTTECVQSYTAKQLNGGLKMFKTQNSEYSELKLKWPNQSNRSMNKWVNRKHIGKQWEDSVTMLQTKRLWESLPSNNSHQIVAFYNSELHYMFVGETKNWKTIEIRSQLNLNCIGSGNPRCH